MEGALLWVRREARVNVWEAGRLNTGYELSG